MENLFIQSFMDTDGKTFLEVGIGENFTSVPSEFNVTLNGTCFIFINSLNYLQLKKKWNIRKDQIQRELEKQFYGTNLIFDIKVK